MSNTDNHFGPKNVEDRLGARFQSRDLAKQFACLVAENSKHNGFCFMKDGLANWS
jgi:hypothetical protein